MSVVCCIWVASKVFSLTMSRELAMAPSQNGSSIGRNTLNSLGQEMQGGSNMFEFTCISCGLLSVPCDISRSEAGSALYFDKPLLHLLLGAERPNWDATASSPVKDTQQGLAVRYNIIIPFGCHWPVKSKARYRRAKSLQT